MSLDFINGSVNCLVACTTDAHFLRQTDRRVYVQQDIATFITKIKKWIERVKACGYIYSIMWECQWDNIFKTDVEVRSHVDSIRCPIH